MFIRCDAKSGYVNEFEVYLGKKDTVATVNGVYFDVVQRLTGDVLHRYHTIYFDNLYTSVPVAMYLLQNKTYCCGTLRNNRRHIPDAVKVNERRLARGQHVTRQDASCRNLCVTVWRDTKCVRFLSTQCQPTAETQASRRVGGVRQNVSQPSVAHSYNTFMGGVDTFDSLRKNAAVGRAAKKSWKYLFFFGFNAAIVNAWLLYLESSPNTEKLDHCQFRHKVAMGLFKSKLTSLAQTMLKSHKHVKLRSRGRLCKLDSFSIWFVNFV